MRDTGCAVTRQPHPVVRANSSVLDKTDARLIFSALASGDGDGGPKCGAVNLPADFLGKGSQVTRVDAINTMDFLALGAMVLIVVAVVCLARYIINL